MAKRYIGKTGEFGCRGHENRTGTGPDDGVPDLGATEVKAYTEHIFQCVARDKVVQPAVTAMEGLRQLFQRKK